MSRPPSRRPLRRRPLVLLHVLLTLGLAAGCRQIPMGPWTADSILGEPGDWHAQLDRAVRIEPGDVVWLRVTAGEQPEGQPADLEGRYVVGPKGSIYLGRFGKVRVGGKSLASARRAVERHLRDQIDEPNVTLVPPELNGLCYYVITQGAGQHDRVERFPLGAGDTVLDAISHIRGLSQLSSTDVWIARHGLGDGSPTEQILPVDWVAITRGGLTATNYALLPGDRIYIAEDESCGISNIRGSTPSRLERFRQHVASTIHNIQTLYRNDD